MRILLIQPPYDLYDEDERQAMPPLGLAYIAAVLERDGHEIQIIDCAAEDFHRLTPLPDSRRRHGLGDEELMQILQDFRPELVGVSCLFSAQAPSAHHVCKVVKEIDPQVRTVMGGAHPSAVPEIVLADTRVDNVILGEGEIVFQRLARALQEGKKLPADISGLAFRKGDSVSINPQQEYLTNLDLLPLPARHLLPMKKYFEYRSPHGAYVKHDPCTNMITSRGCPAKCCFCSIHTVWGRKLRCHSAKRVIEEMQHLIDVYGIREIQFEDDNLTLNKKRMREICQQMIDRKMNLSWTTPNGTALWALDAELIELMRSAGCYHITIAIESGNQDVLSNIIQKPLDLKRVPPIVRACREVGMGISAFFVVGFPGESKADIEKTFYYALNLGVDQACFFTATPFPGTALFQQCLDQGLLETPVDYTKLRVGRPLFGSNDWSAHDLYEMTREAQARFYRHTVLRQPVRFLSTAARKFMREPGVTLRKARDTFVPGIRSTSRSLSTAESGLCPSSDMQTTR